MPKTREYKTTWLADISALLRGSQAVALVNYRGLKALEIDELRGQIRKLGSRLRVVKNTLLKKALTEQGIEVPVEILDQPIAVASHHDEVALSKIVATFAKAHEAIGLHGLIVDGEFQGSDVLRQYAALPSRETLLARLVGSISAPLHGLQAVLSGNLRGLVSLLEQYKGFREAHS